MMHQDILIPSKASFDKGTVAKILLAAHINQILRLDGVNWNQTGMSIFRLIENLVIGGKPSRFYPEGIFALHLCND